MLNPEIMDTVLLTRTHSQGWAKWNSTWPINVRQLERWKKIYCADPESREGLYLRLASATVLRPAGSGNRGAGMQKKPSPPFVRYMHFRKAHENGELSPSFP